VVSLSTSVSEMIIYFYNAFPQKAIVWVT